MVLRKGKRRVQPNPNDTCVSCNQSVYNERHIATTILVDGKPGDTFFTCASCDLQKKKDEFFNKEEYSTWLVNQSIIPGINDEKGYPEQDKELVSIYQKYKKEIEPLVNDFEHSIYYPILKPQIKAEKVWSGMSVQVKHVHVMTYCGAGRVMITLEDPDKNYLSLIIGEDAPESYREHFPNQDNFMGMRGIRGTFPQIKDMVNFLKKKDIELSANKNVSIW
jgi:hypothetical protein